MDERKAKQSLQLGEVQETLLIPLPARVVETRKRRGMLSDPLGSRWPRRSTMAWPTLTSWPRRGLTSSPPRGRPR